MPFTFYSPPTLSPEQVSPFGNLLKNALSKYMLLNQAQYQPKMLQEELLKNQLANKWFEPNARSLIASRQAELSKLPLQKALLEAQIGSAKSLSSKRELIQKLLSQSFNANPFVQEGISQGQQPEVPGMTQGLGPLANPDMIKQKIASQESAQQNMSYPQAELLTKELFGTQPHFIEVNGKHLAVTPFGNIEVAKGLTEEEKATSQGLGKYKAKLYGDSIDAYRGYQNQQAALDNLTDAVENNPQFRNVTGRINQPLTNWFGTPEQKQLLGTLQSSSGEIALQVAPALKGAFTGRDQTLINSIKASPNDFPDVFIGKLKAQKLLNSVLSERAKLTAKLIENGESPLKAADEAAKRTPLSKFKPYIDSIIKHQRNNFSPASSNYDITPDEARAELARRQALRSRNG